MPKIDKKINKLIKAQHLCETVHAQTQALAATCQLAAELQTNLSALAAFYEKEWRHLREDPDLNEAALERLSDASSGTTYSVLGEDTIWNLLYEAEQTQRQLLKTLAQSL